MEKKQGKALIIDDEPAITRLCKRILENERFAVDTVFNGKDAEILIDKNEYRLILLDIRLPVLSGIDLYIWIKQKHPEATRNVIFMTGSILGGETMNLMKNSGRLYLLKPFRPDELSNIINAFLNDTTT